MARKIPTHYRLSAELRAAVDATAELRDWTATQVVEHALEEYTRRALGRRHADLVGVRLRGRDRPPTRG